MKLSHVALVAVGAFCIVAGGVYFYARDAGQKQALNVLAQIEAEAKALGEDIRIDHGEVTVDVLSGAATVQNLTVTYTQMAESLTAESVTVQANETSLEKGTAEKVVYKASAGKPTFAFERVTLSDFDLTQARNFEKISSDELLAFLRKLTVGELAVENATIQAREGEISVAEFRIEDTQSGVIDKGTVRGVQVKFPSGPTKEFGLDGFSVRNLDLGSVGTDKQDQSLLDVMGVKELVVSGGYLAASDVDETAKLALFEIKDIRRDDGIIIASRALMDGLDIPLRFLAGKNPVLTALVSDIDLDTMSLKMEAVGDLDLKSGILKQDLDLSAAGMGRIGLALVMSGDPERLRKIAKGEIEIASDQGLEDMKIVDLSLKYDDVKLADWIIDALSAGDRKAFAERLALSAGMAMEKDEKMATQLRRAVQAFVTDAGGFEIAVHPSEPFVVGNVGTALKRGTLGEDLGIDVSGR